MTKKAEAVGYGKIVGIGSIATAAGAAGSEFLTDNWVDIITRVGLPLVLLAIVVRYAVKLTERKDAAYNAMVEKNASELAALVVKKDDAQDAALAKKDAEIKRLNEQRVQDAAKHAQRLFKISEGTTELVRTFNEQIDKSEERNQS